MAHFVLEYSANIDKDALRLQGLFERLHAAALDTGLFPLKGIRSRAYSCDDYRIADGNPDHGFVHLTVLVGAGRSLDAREQAAKQLFAIYSGHFAACFEQHGIAMSFEMKELEAITKFNKNNIAGYL